MAGRFTKFPPGSLAVAGLLAAASAQGCGGDSFAAGESLDAGAESGPDVSLDSGPETSLDAGLDAFLDGESAARWCTQVDAFFCADFDGVEAKEGWTQLEQSGGKVTLDDTSAVSPPNSMRATVFATDAGAVSTSLVKIYSGDAPHGVRVKFHVRVPTDHPSTYASILTVRFGGSTFQFSIALSAGDGGASSYVLESPLKDFDAALPEASVMQHPLSVGLDDGKWKQVELRIEPSHYLSLFVDDALVMQTPATINVPYVSPVIVYMGLSYAVPPASNWTLLYDNVQIHVN